MPNETRPNETRPNETRPNETRPNETREVAPGPDDSSVRFADGSIVKPPSDWSLLAPGDAGLTRRVKAAGPTWTVKEKKGRRTFSRGVWAPKSTIAGATAAIEAERSTDAYKKKQASAKRRRDQKQSEYVGDFESAVLEFLNFDSAHAPLARRMARAITRHATPVGSGTVARTQRIPIGQRAGAAVIAWMRHQTTAYDDMKIARVKGRRREVRRELAEASKKLLNSYRRGLAAPPECPLKLAVESTDNPAETESDSNRPD